MILSAAIAVLWLLAAAAFLAAGDPVFALCAALASPSAILVTLHLRRLAVGLAARRFLELQRERGISAEEAASRVAELAPGGIEIDTDDLPRWGVPAILLSGLLACFALAAGLARTI